MGGVVKLMKMNEMWKINYMEKLVDWLYECGLWILWDVVDCVLCVD